MALRRAAVTLAWASVGASAATRPIPGGMMVDEDCILRVPNEATVDLSTTKARSGCVVKQRGPLGSPRIQIYAADTHFQSEAPITSFTADWVVPPLPAQANDQVVFFWPGLKSKQPEMGYPVIQPVLQYGEGDDPNWYLQSWFVYARDPSFPTATSPAISVSPGDKITSFIRLSSDRKTWTISGTDVTTGQNSTLKIAYADAGDVDYEFAMLVNENVNVDTQCSLMPAASAITFTNVAVDGKHPQWTTRANCAGNPECDCGNKAAVDASSGDVTLSWSTGGLELVV